MRNLCRMIVLTYSLVETGCCITSRRALQMPSPRPDPHDAFSQGQYLWSELSALSAHILVPIRSIVQCILLADDLCEQYPYRQAIR